MFIIDRIEGDLAVIEFNRKTFTIPKSLLPKEAREGDVIQISISIDNHATRDREETVIHTKAPVLLPATGLPAD